MTEQNYKNKLQEYCVANKFSLPKYSTVMIGGDSHKPIWASTVICNNMEFSTTANYNVYFNAKRDAEKEAARLAFEYFQSIKCAQYMDVKQEEIKVTCSNVLSTEQQSITVPINQTQSDAMIKSGSVYYILCDIENIQPEIPKELYDMPNVVVHTFRSVYSNTKMDNYELAKQNEINSNGKDAADHLMTFRAGQLTMNTSSNDVFVIVSRDRSAGILATILQSYGYHVEQYFNTKTFKTFVDKFLKPTRVNFFSK